MEEERLALSVCCFRNYITDALEMVSVSRVVKIVHSCAIERLGEPAVVTRIKEV